MNWDEPASLESPLLIGNRRSRRTSLDLREGVTMQPLCSPRAAPVFGSEHAIPWSRPSPDPPPRAIVGGARPARSCAPCSKRPRARHMLRRRRDVSSVTGDRALQDDPTLKADPLCRSIGGLSCSWEWPDTMFADAVDATIVRG
jgi:hypothetical protein